MMVEDNSFPQISTEFDEPHGNTNYQIYRRLIPNTLKQIVPKEFLILYRDKPAATEELNEHFQSLMPLTSYTSCVTAPSNMSFFIVVRYRPNAFRFYFEMISRWLVPGKRLNVVAFYAADFSIPEFGNGIYTMCEVVIRIDNDKELEEIQRNLPIIDSEVCLGVVSGYYARRILEVKGLSSDEKTAMIQEYIAWISSRWSTDFSYDVFTEMQHVLVMCHDDFKAARNVRHLSRIIGIQYLFRKDLYEKVKAYPEKRHLSLKIFQAKIRFPEGEKKVLGLIVAMTFLRDKEIFEENHLIKAVQNYIPQVKMVENSSFFNRRGSEPICTLYLEIEKGDGKEFTGEELRVLRRELPNDLAGRVEYLMQPVFMPRNEEEVMRNILTLSQQIKYIRDIPQMFITFDEQTHHHLFFTVIIVRVFKEGDAPLEDAFNRQQSFLEYIHDRIKSIGYIRKKYPKEATVFRVKVSKEQFLRNDHSIDLYKARQMVVTEIARVIGDVRDYNGGMISKQNELLSSVRSLLKHTVKYNETLLENFFYSLNPVIMRTLSEPEALKKLFLMLLETISDGFYNEENYSMKVRAEPLFVYVMIATEDKKIENEITNALKPLKLSSNLATSSIHVQEVVYLGYLLRCDDAQKQRKFYIAIQHAVEALEHSRV